MDQSKEMARIHGPRWFTLRHDFIDRFGSVIKPSTIVTNRRFRAFADGSDVNGEPEAKVPAWLFSGWLCLRAILSSI